MFTPISSAAGGTEQRNSGTAWGVELPRLFVNTRRDSAAFFGHSAKSSFASLAEQPLRPFLRTPTPIEETASVIAASAPQGPVKCATFDLQKALLPDQAPGRQYWTSSHRHVTTHISATDSPSVVASRHYCPVGVAIPHLPALSSPAQGMS